MNAPAKQLPPDDGMWLRSLRADVQPMTFKKGRQYAEARRVSGLVRTETGIAAKVAGSEGEKYDVQLAAADSGKIESKCNCAAWNKEGPHCKHVVAAALIYLARIRSMQADQTPASQTPVDAVPGESVNDDLSPPTGPTEFFQADAVSMPGLAKLENWLGLSAQPDLEFVYRLTPTNSQTGSRLWVIDVRCRMALGTP